MKRIILAQFLITFCMCTSNYEIKRDYIPDGGTSGILQITVEDDLSVPFHVQLFGSKNLPEDHRFLEVFEWESDFYIKSSVDNRLKIKEGEYYTMINFQSVSQLPLLYSDISRKRILFGFDHSPVSEEMFAEKKFHNYEATECQPLEDRVLCPKIKIERNKIKEIKIRIGSEKKINGRATLGLWLNTPSFPLIPIFAGFAITEREITIPSK